jgi:hypothetical protein
MSYDDCERLFILLRTEDAISLILVWESNTRQLLQRPKNMVSKAYEDIIMAFKNDRWNQEIARIWFDHLWMQICLCV